MQTGISAHLAVNIQFYYKSLTAAGKGWGIKDGKGINQRTFMHNPWTLTTIWGLVCSGERVGLSGGREREKKQEQL